MAEQKSFYKDNKRLAVTGAVFFLMVSWALYFFAPQAGHYEVDSPSYEKVARYFVQTGSVINPDGSAPIHTQGYHFFLGMVYWLLGTQLWKLILLQVLLALCAIFSITQMAFLLGGTLCARIVFLLALVDGAFLVYPQFMLADTLLLFLLALFFKRMAYFYTTKEKKSLILAGLFLGLAIIVKPTAVLFPPALLFCFFVLSRFTTLSVTPKDGLFFLGAAYFPVVLYIIRNGLMFGVYKLTFLTEFCVYQWLNAMLNARLQGLPFEQVLTYFNTLVDTRFTDLQAGYWAPLKKIFFETCLHHPWAFLKLCLQNVSRTFFGLYSVQLQILFNPGLQGAIMPFHSAASSCVLQSFNYFAWAYKQSQLVGSLMLFECVGNGIRWILVFSGAWKLWKEQAYEILLFSVCVVGCFSAITGFFGAGRYRITFEPILLFFAAQGAVSVYRYYKKR